MPYNIATNASSRDEHEGGAANSKASDGDAANAVEAKVNNDVEPLKLVDCWFPPKRSVHQEAKRLV